MGLLEDVKDDLRVAPLQPLSWQDDPRGEAYGQRWVPVGQPIGCAYAEMSTSERFEAGRQQSDRMIRAFVDLVGIPPVSPIGDRQAFDLAGRRYDVTSVRTIVSPGDEGAIVEAVGIGGVEEQ